MQASEVHKIRFDHLSELEWIDMIALLRAITFQFMEKPSTQDVQYSRLDADAIQAVKSGEVDRFQELIERYQNRIIGLIGRQVGNRALAEELAQETFVRAYRGLKSFQGESTFSTWLIRIALNTTKSYFSSKRYKQAQRSESFDSTRHDREHETEDVDQAELAAQKEAMREELARLKPHLQEVIILCGFEGKQYQEAADILKIPIGTVRSRLNKARLTLRKLLGIKESANAN